MPALIRLARQSDLADIFHVRTSVGENHLSVEQLAQMGITEQAVSEMIGASPCAWVAVVDGRVVGFSMIDIEDASLFAAFVLPAYEGRGLGKGLVQAAEEKLFESHAEIWLETGRETRAAGFYRSLGWGNEQDIGRMDIRLIKRRT